MNNLILDYYRQKDDPYVDYSSQLERKPDDFWYPFPAGAKVLCVGSRDIQSICKGEISVTLIEPSYFRAYAYREIDNLQIYVGCLSDVQLESKGFDYTVAENPDEVELAILFKLVKNTGKILIRTCAIDEVLPALRQSDWNLTRFYFPLGDGIYSEMYMPSVEEYLSATSGEVASEEEYKRATAILEKGIFAHFLPEVIIEASQYDILGDPIYRPMKEKDRKCIIPIDQDAELIAKVKEVQLALLRELKRICDQHGLKLFLFYGSLLGAVRHEGFIPGDDDIDVLLLRDDYDKLISLANEFPENMFLQTPENDDCFYGGYLKLRDKRTAAIVPQNWWKQCCEGIYIDIFPLDQVCGSPIKEKVKRFKILQLQRLMYAKAYGYFERFLGMQLLEWKFYKYCGVPMNRKKLSDRLTREMKRDNKSVPGAVGGGICSIFGKWTYHADIRSARLYRSSAARI